MPLNPFYVNRFTLSKKSAHISIRHELEVCKPPVKEKAAICGKFIYLGVPKVYGSLDVLYTLKKCASTPTTGDIELTMSFLGSLYAVKNMPTTRVLCLSTPI